MLSLRLAQYVIAMKPLPKEIPEYKEAYNLWESQMNANKDLNPYLRIKILNLIEKVLTERTGNDSKYFLKQPGREM